MKFRAALFFVFLVVSSSSLARAQSAAPAPASATNSIEERFKALESSVRYAEEHLAKAMDDLVWLRRLEEIAVIDKVRFTGPPPRVTNNPTAQGAGNPLVIAAYTFVPKTRPEKIPLMVFVHGGVHSDFKTSDELHITRELLEQGYAIIAPEYRGSTGYGKEFWEQIDYGGLENEDVFAGKQWMVENHAEVDGERVGILGWSHGGMITLMNIFDHPADYKAAYAGVPVSDLVARMGYKGDGYRALFAAPYHIGKTAEENVNEYRRRSPAWNAEKLQTPLFIETNTNDEDVNVLEVEHLVQALKAAGKNFEYKIYTNAPGGHQFNRLDTKLAKESRAGIYRFFAKHLNPPKPVQ
jgi:dipeptidyl aminopeptidase/acylaminoacyl peptidase